MRFSTFQQTLAALTVAMLVAMGSGTAQAAEQTLISTATVVNNDNWNQTPNWDNLLVPSGTDSAVISAGLGARANSSATPTYSGGLTMQEDSSLRIDNTGGSINAIGTGPIVMYNNTTINTATQEDPHFGAITLNGDATFTNGSNAADWDQRYFDGVISGTGSLTLVGRNGVNYYFNESNTFSGGLIANAADRYRIYFKAPGSAGAGDVTVNPRGDGRSAVLIVDAADAIADTATLTLNGMGWNGSGGGGEPFSRSYIKLIMNEDDTVDKLFIDDVQAPAGTYTGTADKTNWIYGPGSLTVLTGPVVGNPTVEDFSDEYFSAGPNEDFNTIWQDFAKVNYSVTFSNDMDESTIDASDFSNAGDATGWSIGTITKTVTPPFPNASSTFNVEVLLSSPSAGSLQLQVNDGAELKDVLGNPVDTTSAILDDTTITINAGDMPAATITGTAGGPNGGHDTWNNPDNWDGGFVPFGPGDAIVGPGVMAQVWNNDTPAYTGGLTLEENSTLQIGWTTSYPASLNALGQGGITMKDGSTIILRQNAASGPVVFQDIAVEGAAVIWVGRSTARHHQTTNFDGEISGPGQLTIDGVNNSTVNLNAANTIEGGLIAKSSQNQSWRLEAEASGSLGAGDVTIEDFVSLVINAPDAIADNGVLTIVGKKDSRRSHKLFLNYEGADYIAGFWVDGTELGPGTYDSTSGLIDIDGNPLMTGSGQLIVRPPALFWQEGVAGNWADEMWTYTPGTPENNPPAADVAMTIDEEGAVVTVAADFVSGGSGPAASVAVGETHTAALAVGSGVTLEVTGNVGVGEFGTLQVDGTLQAAAVNAGGVVSGSGTITGDLTLSGGTVLPGTSVGTLTVDGNVTVGNGATYVAELQDKGTSGGLGTGDLLAVTGTLDLQGTDDVLAVEWLPGSEPGSKFGGEYVVATAAEAQIVGSFDQRAGNIAAYIDVVDIDDGVGTGQAKLAVVLFDLLDGDATLDGTVSLADLSVLGGNWLGSGKSWFEGDFTFDGSVSLADLSLLGGSWLQSVGGGGGGGMTLPATAVSAVPEPGTLLMLLAAGLALAFAWRQRRRR